jgi:thiamine biosynthesis lipoprotein
MINKYDQTMTPYSWYSRLVASVLILVLILLLTLSTGCKAANKSLRFQTEWTGSFDTVIQMIVYTDSEQTFQKYVTLAKKRFQELHQLYDIYNVYPGINNIRTINEKSGLEPIVVDQAIIDLLLFCQQHSQQTGGVVDITLGPVLAIWHTYREAALADPSKSLVPPMSELQTASKLADATALKIDQTNRTVQLSRVGMSLDIGAVAKGFATQRIADELKTAGLTSGILSAGGSSVLLIGKPADPERPTWNIAVQDPDGNLLIPDGRLLDTISTNDNSIDTSGDYQRYYTVEGVVYHHLIDPKTLMPGRYYRAVTVMTPDNGLADFLSTTLFLLPIDQGLAILKQYPGSEALWVFADNTIKATAGMRVVLRNQTALPAD